MCVVENPFCSAGAYKSYYSVCIFYITTGRPFYQLDHNHILTLSFKVWFYCASMNSYMCECKRDECCVLICKQKKIFSVDLCAALRTLRLRTYQLV